MYMIGVSVFLALLILATSFSGTSSAFIDYPSVLIILLMTLPIVIGSGLFQDLKRSFKVAMSKKNVFTRIELEKSLIAVDLTMKMIALSGGIGTLIGLIAILRYLSDLSTLGPNLSVAMLTLFYALFGIGIFMPIKAKIKVFLLNS